MKDNNLIEVISKRDKSIVEDVDDNYYKITMYVGINGGYEYYL